MTVLLSQVLAIWAPSSAAHSSASFPIASARRAIVSALLLAVLLVPLWAYAPRVALLVLGAFLLQFCVQGAWGVIPAHLSELSPNSIRGFLPGFAYQCGVLLAGPVSYVEALLAEKMSYATAMAATAASVFLFTAIVAALGREKKGLDFQRASAAEL